VTIPGPRHINPDDETARQRSDPPQREWAIRHPDGKITVRIDGHAYPGRTTAEKDRAASDQDCEWCDGGTHTLTYRDRQPWQDTP
jgi:hypothetical protein